MARKRGKGVRRLTDEQLETLRKELTEGALAPGSHNNPYPVWYDQEARFVAPLGELISSLQGFAWGWKMRAREVEICPLTKKDQFNAQGLEGKFSINCTLGEAIIYWVQCPKHRATVYV